MTDCSCSQFIGNLTGNASTATVSTSSNQVNVQNLSDDSTHFLGLVLGDNNRSVKRSTKFTANHSSGSFNVAGKIIVKEQVDDSTQLQINPLSIDFKDTVQQFIKKQVAEILILVIKHQMLLFFNDVKCYRTYENKK